MRIVIISEGFLPELSGVTNSLYNKVLCLSNLGHHVQVYAPDYSELHEIYPDFQNYTGKILPNVEVISYPSKPYHIKTLRDPKPFSLRTLEKSIMDFRPDILHVECPERLYMGFLARPGIKIAKKMGIPATAMFHTDYTKHIDDYKSQIAYLKIPGIKTMMRKLVKWVYNSYDKTMVTDVSIKEILLKRGIRNIVQNTFLGVDMKIFDPEIFATPKELQPNRNKIIVSYIGRLSIEKKIDKLINVFESVREKTDKCAFLIIGNGQEVSKVRNWAKKDPCNMHIPSISPHKISNYFLASDIFVTNSPNETFGLTILEAMAAELPVVAPDTKVSRNLVSDKETGFLFPYTNSEQFADALVKLAFDLQLRQKMGAKAIKKAANFSWEAATLNMMAVWKDLLNKSRKRFK